MYTEKALAIRRCKAIKADGTPCKSFAVWGKENQLCASHQPSKKIHKPRNPNRKKRRFHEKQPPPPAPAKPTPTHTGPAAGNADGPISPMKPTNRMNLKSLMMREMRWIVAGKYSYLRTLRDQFFFLLVVALW